MEDNPFVKQIDPKRLKWACRRGMLELDILLGRFLEEAYPALSPEMQVRFAELLAYPDPEVWTWLMGQDLPENQSLIPIIQAIRAHV
jgi:antitoxin CptB